MPILTMARPYARKGPWPQVAADKFPTAPAPAMPFDSRRIIHPRCLAVRANPPGRPERRRSGLHRNLLAPRTRRRTRLPRKRTARIKRRPPAIRKRMSRVRRRRSTGTTRTPSSADFSTTYGRSITVDQSKKPTNCWLRHGCCSLRTALASICRIRSRVTLKMWPTSSNV